MQTCEMGETQVPINVVLEFCMVIYLKNAAALGNFILILF